MMESKVRRNKLTGYIDEYRPLMKNQSFMKIIIAGLISSFGSKISYFALLRKVYLLSNGRITDLGFLSIAQSLPYMLFGTLAGIVIDSLPRKWVMIFSDITSSLVTVSVIFVHNLNYIYFIGFMASFVYVFRNPAQSSFEPNLVRRCDLPLLNSFESSVNSLIQVVGSALGAAIVGFVGMDNAFIIDGITFLISAAIITRITINERHINKNRIRRRKTFKLFGNGMSIMFMEGSLRLMLLIDMYVTFAMSMQGPLLYFFIRQDLHMGDEAELAWGILLSALGIGAMLGSLAIGLLVKRYKNKFRLLLNMLMFDAVVFTLFLLNTYFPISVLIFTFLGCIGTAHMIILNTVIQDTVPDENRGKVFSTFAMIRSPVSILSILAGTTAAAIIGTKEVLLIVAGVEALIAIGVRFTKTYRCFQRRIV